jgi:hypothetical protein
MAIQKITDYVIKDNAVDGTKIAMSSDAVGDIMYYNGTDWVRLAKGEPGEVLTMNDTETAPQWGTGTPACNFTGTQRGYSCGGWKGPGTIVATDFSNNIEKYSFSTDENSTAPADIVFARRFVNGHSSETHGFVTGGYLNVASIFNQIDRFSFTNDIDATDWSDLSGTMRARSAPASSCTHGFTYGGSDGTGSNTNVIDKFPFASQTPATDWADAVKAQFAGAGCSSDTYGYALGGTLLNGTTIKSIERYPFATQTNGTEVGEITVARHTAAGVSSLTHGYACGGLFAPFNFSDIIDRVSFASDATVSDHGDLIAILAHPSASSSTTHGYVCGGTLVSVPGTGNSTISNVIQKFAYASNITASDVGDLIIAADGMSGHQY